MRSSRKLKPRTVACASVLFLALIGLACVYVDVGAVREWGLGLNSAGLFLLASALPLVCFPVSLLYFLLGAKFGFGFGLFLAAISIGLNLTAAHLIASKFLRRPIEWLACQSKFRLPRAPAQGQASLSFITALLPGPYGLKNYLLAASGVQLKTYLAVCLPIYVLRAASGILFGRLGGHFTIARALFAVAYTAIVTAVSYYVIKRLRKNSSAQPCEAVPALAVASCDQGKSAFL